MATETELKYSLTTDHVPAEDELAAAFAAVGLTLGPVGSQVLKDRYYDDARLSLARAGLALRRRMADGELLATLKTLGTVEGALHRRDEVELPIPESADAWDPWPEPIAERLRVVTDTRSLRGTFELVTERTRFEVRDGGRAVAVASFDDVAARRPSGERSVHWNELEIESVPAPEGDDRGPEAAEAASALLGRAAEALGQVVTLVPSSHTKLERARALLMLGAALGEPDDGRAGGEAS